MGRAGVSLLAFRWQPHAFLPTTSEADCSVCGVWSPPMTVSLPWGPASPPVGSLVGVGSGAEGSVEVVGSVVVGFSPGTHVPFWHTSPLGQSPGLQAVVSLRLQ
jgi:hypothetical protein